MAQYILENPTAYPVTVLQPNVLVADAWVILRQPKRYGHDEIWMHPSQLTQLLELFHDYEVNDVY